MQPKGKVRQIARWLWPWHRVSPQLRRRILIVAAALCGLMIGVQLCYPSSRALPSARLGETAIGGKTSDEIGADIREQAKRSTVALHSQDRLLVQVPAEQLGVRVRSDEVLRQATRYPWWLRLVPTSLFWAGPQVTEFAVSLDTEAVQHYRQQYAAQFDAPAVNALLKVENTRVVIEPSKKGAQLSQQQLADALRREAYLAGGTTRIAVQATLTEPNIHQSALEPLRKRLQGAIDKKLVLQHAKTTATPTAAVIASWLQIKQEQATKPDEIAVALDGAAITKYAAEQFRAATVPAGVTEVFLVDGVEQRRKEGVTGRTIDGGALTTTLTQQLLDETPQTTVAIPTRSLPPRIKRQQQFTKSQAGLAAYVQSLAEEGDIRVSVQQLGGRGWQASYRGGERSVAASTYKVYVVAYMLQEMREGRLKESDELNGTTVGTCIERTIINSDNPCPEAMLKKATQGVLNEFLRARGFSAATTFTGPYATTSTQDLVKAMRDIESGSLVAGAERDRMLGLMARTRHRQGVPAGSAAPRVYNKVGFLEGYLNDAAIVQHPGGTYVISVITKGKSWGTIAAIAKKVEELMY